MNEREALLLAILRQPEDRTARLVYADWLDDRHDLPAAQATAEFIRVACKGTKTNRGLPRQTYPWFRENWKRLVPSVLALSAPRSEPWPFPDGVPWLRAEGLRVDLSVILPGNITTRPGTGRQVISTRLYPCRLRLWFDGGLCCDWKMGSAWGKGQVGPALGADQPQLFLDARPETFRVAPPESA